MRRFVNSPAYVRVRAVTGLLLVAMGVTIVVRTLLTVGPDVRASVPIIAGAIFFAAGALRLRDYMRLRKNNA